MTDEIPKLFPFQLEGVAFLCFNRHALLGDSMGLGKTAQVITAADKIKANRILVLCPAAARINWKREFEKFSLFPRLFQIVETRSSKVAQTESVICSYDLAQHLPVDIGHFDLLVIDECHFLKSLQTKRTIAVLGRKGLVHNATRTWALSGTPAPNHAGELWPILYTFGATTLTYEAFVHKFCTTYKAHFRGVYKDQITGTKESAIPELKTLLNKIMLRRRKEDVMKELPPITFEEVTVERCEVDLMLNTSFTDWVFPTDRSAELHEKLKKEREIIEGALSVTTVGTSGLKTLEALAQSVSTLRRYTGLQKVDQVAELVSDELASDAYEKIVIFAIHRDVIEGLRIKLSKFGAVTLYGGTEPSKRQKNIDKFQNSPKTRVFIGNIHAAGTAITLTAAHNVMFVEQDWVPGNNAQACMRCHRIGQTKPVFVRFVSLNDSMDERIARILKRKTRELTDIFDLPSKNDDDSSLSQQIASGEA